MVENIKKQVFSVRGLVEIGMLSALAFVLMMFSFPLPFAPSFYKLDFSELPVIIGAFAIHPFAGVMIEFIIAVFLLHISALVAFLFCQLLWFIIIKRIKRMLLLGWLVELY